MNIKELEAKREEVISFLAGGFSPRLKLFFLNGFIEEIFKFNNKNIAESYLVEFFDEYSALVKIFEPTGIEPSKVEEIISALAKIIALPIFGSHINNLTSVKEKLQGTYEEITESLKGNEVQTEEHLYFPVMEYNRDDAGRTGFLEYLDIKISKNSGKNEDSFFVLPSADKVEKLLNEQVKNSWKVALKFLREKSLIIKGYHDVVVSFNKKYGQYAGNSLGLVLTLGFIEELLRYYQTRDIIKIKSGIAMTGSIDGNGTVMPLTEEIISAKTEVAFYSNVKYLVVPNGSKDAAVRKLELLRKKFVHRRIKVIEIESIFDLIDRRTLVDVKKINLGLYFSKKLNKRKYTVAFIILLIVTSGYLYLKDYDKNPYSINITGHILSVKNKFNNTLWQTSVSNNYPSPVPKYEIDPIARVIDINKDGRNEVIVTSETYNELKDKNELGRIACFDYNHRLIWKYVFRDSIATRVEKFTPYYSLKIFAVKNDIPNPVIIAVGQHENFYPSPIIKIRARDGKRIGKIFWHPGGGSRGFLNDIDGDGKDELVATAISNGLERCVLYSLEYDKLQGTAPTTPDYRFLNQPIADFDHYIVLPKTDVNEYFGERYNVPGSPPIITYDSLIYFNITEVTFPDGMKIGNDYEFDRNFNLKDIIIGDKFRVIRDSLVAQGKIKGPFTESPAYTKYLRDQIKYWNGSKFISIKDIK